jgi:phosphate transport system substrate-binding protein
MDDRDHDKIVSLLWELKAAYQASTGKEDVLVSSLLLDRAQLDLFLSDAIKVDDPALRSLVARIVALRQGQPLETITSTAASTSPAAGSSSGFDAIRGGAVVVASVLVSIAAARYLFFAPVPPIAAPAAVVAESPRKAPPSSEPRAAEPENPVPADVSHAVEPVAAAVPAVIPAAAPEKAMPTAPPPPPPLSLANSDVILRIHGSNTVGEQLTPALVEAFLRSSGAPEIAKHTGSAQVEKSLVGALPDRKRPVAIEVHAHGSSTAFSDLAAGSTDMGQSSRRIKTEEVDALRERHGDLSRPGSEHVVALDGLAIITHPGNPVTRLSVDEVAKIFAGKIRDWAEVGGNAGPMALYARDDVSGTWDTFKHLVLAPGKHGLDAAAKRFESSSELSDAVSRDPQGIGFIGLPYVRRSKLLAVSAVEGGIALVPTPFTVATEDYPLSRRLYFYTPSTSDNETMRRFVDFALSEQGQDIVRTVGFVSQNITLEKPAQDAAAPEGYRTVTAGAERLSLNLRFEAGHEDLDAKALRDLDRMVTFLTKHSGREMLLLGFTDDRGQEDSNVRLSRRRAEGAAEALQARGVFPREVLGFGEASPVASNGSEEGRNRNRRVEVWVR